MKISGKQLIQKIAHYRFIDEAFNISERNARGKKSSWMKSRLKKASRKVRRNKNYKNEL